ncbi:MAG: amidohydrolase family protein [Desulfosarcina sp.]|nr:amidohydrolase family protein [Desulfosarcina sp.]MBC2742198.1 amidohydrolase family protein [Desulfosarcina sp.]MBC2765110.1 amidohydrolase family protein [Desulfosarcina sp.]
MPAYDLLIKGGYLVDPANAREGRFDLATEGGKVVRVDPEIGRQLTRQVYEAEGCLVLPGLIDTHVHLTPAIRAAGFHMLAAAGVTTALDCAGPVEAVLEGMALKGSGINVAVLNRLTPGGSLSSEHAPKEEVRAYVEKSLADGAFGIKLIGGHLPLSPETTISAIEAANEAGCYAAFHCGSIQNGSNLHGFLDALEFAGDNHLQICHVNAYCRGLTHGSPAEETLLALKELAARPHLVSESHMGPLNSCWSRLNEGGKPYSHVTRTCLTSGGYSMDRQGLLAAAKDGYMQVQRAYPGEVAYLEPEKGAGYLKEIDFETMVSFPVNRRSTAFLCATAKNPEGGFIVSALSTDGGAIPRNFLLSHGLALVRFDALSLAQFVQKASWIPALMLGLFDKGHLAPGADADLVVVDSKSHTPLLTVAKGRIIMAGGMVVGRGGKLVTTDFGVQSLTEQGVDHEVADIGRSLFYTAPEGCPRPSG